MSFLLVWSLRASGVVAVGLLLAFLLRGRSAALRNLVLRLTLAVAYALPLFATLVPRVDVATPSFFIPKPIPITPLPQTATKPASITQGWTVEEARLGGPGTNMMPIFARRAPGSITYFPVWALLLVGWMGGVGFLVLRWVRGIETLLRLRRTATPTDAPDVWRTAIAVPATYGRTIFVPLESAEWPEARLHAAILHERAHVERRDWHWQTLSAGFAAVHWINPLAWLLARALRDSAEAADDAVLAQGVLPSVYARELLAVAAKVGPSGPALAMARRSGVKDRVVAVLSTERDRRPPSWRVAILVGVAAILLACAFAGIEERQKPALGPNSAGIYRFADGRTVQLVEMSDFDATSGRRWSPEGRLLGTYRKGHLPLTKPVHLGWRRVGIVLRQRGGTVRDAAVRVQESPRLLFVSGLGYGLDDHKEIEQWITRFDVPAADKWANLTLLFSTGPWKDWRGKVVVDRRGSASFGVSGYREMLTASLPPELAGRDVRLAVYDKQGRRRTSGRPLMPATKAGPVSFAIPNLGWVDLGRVAFEYRENETVQLPSIALKPLAAGPMAAEQSHKIELVGFAEGGHAWHPDGTPTTGLVAPTSRATTPKGWRRVAVALRVGGDLDNSSVTATVWGKYAYPSDDSHRLLSLPGQPAAPIVWCSVPMRTDVSVAKLGVDLFAGPLRTLADATPGDGPGRATVWRDGTSQATNRKVFNNYEVVFHGLKTPGRESYSVIQTFNTQGALRNTYVGALPFGPHGGYQVGLSPSERPGRFVLRSCPIEHARFEGVHLRPNP